MENLKFFVRVFSLVLTISVLIGCGANAGTDASSVQASESSSIEGTWRSNECVPNAEKNAFITEEVLITADGFTQTEISYFDSEDCSGDRLSVLDESTGDVLHVDVYLVRARITASELYVLSLEAQCTTLQKAAASRGIGDINNIPISLFTDSPQLYTILSLDGDTLRFGIETSSRTGLKPELRHDTLSETTYSRVGPLEEFSDSVDAGVLGVVFYEGKFKSKLDGMGQMIMVQKGEGTFIVLEDHTAVFATSAPNNFNLDTYQLEEGAKITTLKDLDIDASEIFPPLAAGYRFDFRGKSANASYSGAKFRYMTFSNDGTFERKVRSSRESSDSTGTYHIVGNSIELTFNNGDVERTVFASDGSTKVIIGQHRYIPR